MIDKFIGVIGTIFAVTAVGIALRPGAPTAQVITAGANGIATMQRAAYGA